MYATPYHSEGNAVVESFHQYLHKSTSALARQVTWDIHEVLSSVLMAYRATPHPAHGYAPFFLLTGTDMCLPHRQEWSRIKSPASTKERFADLTVARQFAIDRMIRVIIDRQSRDKRSGKRLPNFKVGDLVIRKLPEIEARALARKEKASAFKTTPKWSEPCRILSFDDKNPQIAEVQLLWEKKATRRVNVDDLLLIPRDYNPDTRDMGRLELLTELKRAPLLDRTALFHRHLLQLPIAASAEAKQRLQAWQEATQDLDYLQDLGADVELEGEVEKPLRLHARKRRRSSSSSSASSDPVAID